MAPGAMREMGPGAVEPGAVGLGEQHRETEGAVGEVGGRIWERWGRTGGSSCKGQGS